jgi:uncharacterized PurR-regulated membrane protein YhhQ (DUF165 family)
MSQGDAPSQLCLRDRRAAASYAFAYIASVVLANLTLDIFIDLPVTGTFTFGTVFFAGTFTFRDRVHHLVGSRVYVYKMIAWCALANVLAAWATGTPMRFIVASFTAIVLAESADTEVYHRLRERSWAARVLASNAVSVPVDTLVFVTIAFAGSLAFGDIREIFVNDVLWKFGVAAIFATNVTRRQRARYEKAVAEVAH